MPGPLSISNPIISRELRWRWRGHSWLYVFAYATLMSVLLGGYYYYIVDDSASRQGFNPNDIASGGHALFQLISGLQIWAILLIAPSQTATVIVAEREQGMLEAMQLTPLPPLRIITGKLFSVFLFLLTLLLVPLPIVAVSFMLGGVSPGEFCLVLLLQAVTAATCAMLGLACSARCRRSGNAMFLVFFLTICWLVSTVLMTSAIQWILQRRPMGLGTPGNTGPYWIDWVAQAMHLYSQTNPVTTLFKILEPLPGTPFAGFTELPTAVACLGFQVVLSLVLLITAVNAVRRPLGEFREKPRRRKNQKAKAAAATTTPVVEATQSQTQARRAQPLRLPLPSLDFINPVLRRELMVRFQSRPLSSAQRRATRALVILGAFIYVLILRHLWLYGYDFGPPAWFTFLGSGLLFAAGLMGAMAFTREREKHTWEGLQLSLMSPEQVVYGKAGAIVIASLIYMVPIWPLVAAWYSGPKSEVRYGWYAYVPGRGADLFHVLPILAALVVVGLTALWFCTAVGMIISWFQRTTPAAVGWSITALGVSSLVALNGSFSMAQFVPAAISTLVLQCCHPAATLAFLLYVLENATYYNHYGGYRYVNSETWGIISVQDISSVRIVCYALLTATGIFSTAQIMLKIVLRDIKRSADRLPR